MDERFVKVGEVELCYESFGPEDGEPLLLVMGLGTQMVAWHEDFCGGLAERGFRVVRFDNRDIGRSTHFTGHRPPTPWQLVRRDKAAAAYRLEDMADDTAGLIDALGWTSAHVVGASMGGMIAQCLAVQHPAKVRSLTSIMSTTGATFAGQPALGMYPVLLKRAPGDRQGAVAHTLGVLEAIGSPDFEHDPADRRRVAELAYDRDPHHDGRGAGRQLAAIIASGNRTAAVKRITAPTVVVHGTKDRLVRSSGGKATAKAIHGAELVLIDGMGHDLPRAAWPRLFDAIDRVAARAGGGRSMSASVG